MTTLQVDDYMANAGMVGTPSIVTKDEVKGFEQACECDAFWCEVIDQEELSNGSFAGNVYLPLADGFFLKFSFKQEADC